MLAFLLRAVARFQTPNLLALLRALFEKQQKKMLLISSAYLRSAPRITLVLIALVKNQMRLERLRRLFDQCEMLS